jgi:hypothetical protein
MIDPHSTIFSTKSPIKQLDSEGYDDPMPMSSSEHKKQSAKLLSKLQPLLQAKIETDKVYSDGYFERHYATADRKLKKLIHQRVMGAWSNAIDSEDKGGGAIVHVDASAMKTLFKVLGIE